MLCGKWGREGVREDLRADNGPVPGIRRLLVL
jgi:hypothetical protein